MGTKGKIAFRFFTACRKVSHVMLTFHSVNQSLNANAEQSSTQTKRFAWIALTVVLLSTSTFSCSPGRGGSRRRSSRKLTPLVFKEHVPKLPENAFGASGPPMGRIHRNDERFRTLIPNYNPDIIFKDEEGTGADRLMTQRCRERLEALSISVMNQWPGVKLRVTEGWDEERHHAESSLHYEGRAVDITTSDRDPSKYGMLARLAVDAGFDWVYYESRSYIHCSVKADTRLSEKTIGCFSGDGRVNTPYGDKLIKDIQAGEKVLVADSDFSLAFSEVILFLHKDDQITSVFAMIEVDSRIIATLTVEHLLYVANEGNAYRIIFARDITIGHQVFVHIPGESKLSPKAVTAITFVEMRGVYAPLTKGGNIVVDGVLASCYAEIDNHNLAHWALFPIRALQNFKTFTSSIMSVLHRPQHRASDKSFPETFCNNSGIHWYASLLRYVLTFLLPESN